MDIPFMGVRNGYEDVTQDYFITGTAFGIRSYIQPL